MMEMPQRTSSSSSANEFKSEKAIATGQNHFHPEMLGAPAPSTAAMKYNISAWS